MTDRDHGFLTPDQVRAIVDSLRPADPVQSRSRVVPMGQPLMARADETGIFAVFEDVDRTADQTRREADTFRTWINGFLTGLAAMAALVLGIWILW